MKITIKTNEFKKAMEKIFKVTSVKTLTPVLENILVTVTGNDLYLTANNLVQYARTKIFADSDGDASFVFSDTKSLLKAMKFFTEPEIVIEYAPSEKTEGGAVIKAGDVIISCGSKKATQKTEKAEAFPLFPNLSDNLTNNMAYSNKKLQERFNAIKYAVGKNNVRNVLNGICFKDSDMVASDSRRLALNKDENFAPLTPFIIPPATIDCVKDIIGEELLITTDKKYIRFADGSDADTMVCSRLIDGEYMDYLKPMQERGEIEVEIDIKEYSDSLKYLQTFSDNKSNYEISWYRNTLGFKNCHGYYESSAGVSGGNMDVEIGFNGNFMQEAFSQFKGTVKINIHSIMKPMILTSESDDNNIALVLLLKLKE